MMPSPIWLLAALLGGTALAAPPYAASVRTPQLGMALDLESPHELDLTDEITGTSPNVPPASPLLAERSSVAKINFQWVRRWAAIGDSYTAGIGAGQPLGSRLTNREDWKCSRYTHSWPRLMERWFGKNLLLPRDFQFPACSGARSMDIWEQARALKHNNLDLVIMTAGGNDLCLNALIKKCVLLAYDGEDACAQVLAAAESNMKTVLMNNLSRILEELFYKMADNGIVMIMGYAPFFNTDNDDCREQDWALPEFWKWRYQLELGLKLTKDRRIRLNKLVADVNNVIRDVVLRYRVDPRYDKLNIDFVDWSMWPAKAQGQMCDPKSDGIYPDNKQPELMFFKPNTKPVPRHTGLKVRDVDGGLIDDGEQSSRKPQQQQEGQPLDLSMNRFYDSPLYKSPNPRAVARAELDPRAPSTPTCPGDNDWNIEIPDSLAKYFHPNVKGHAAMASFALKSVAIFRAKTLNLPGADVCKLKPKENEPTCYGSDPSKKAFVTWSVMDDRIKEWCNMNAQISHPGGNIDWGRKQIYHKDTPDEFEVSFSFSSGAILFNKARCLESYARIIHGCDGNNPANPLNYKFGGVWKRGEETYTITPKRSRTMHTHTDGACRGHDKGLWVAYKIHGRGWASDDWGVHLKKKIVDCVGEGVGEWKFQYYKKDGDNHQWEWWSTFTLPGGVINRCWNNLKIQRAAGGYTHKLRKRYEDERYEDFGCAGSEYLICWGYRGCCLCCNKKG